MAIAPIENTILSDVRSIFRKHGRLYAELEFCEDGVPVRLGVTDTFNPHAGDRVKLTGRYGLYTAEVVSRNDTRKKPQLGFFEKFLMVLRNEEPA